MTAAEIINADPATLESKVVLTLPTLAAGMLPDATWWNRATPAVAKVCAMTLAERNLGGGTDWREWLHERQLGAVMAPDLGLLEQAYREIGAVRTAQVVSQVTAYASSDQGTAAIETYLAWLRSSSPAAKVPENPYIDLAKAFSAALRNDKIITLRAAFIKAHAQEISAVGR